MLRNSKHSLLMPHSHPATSPAAQAAEAEAKAEEAKAAREQAEAERQVGLSTDEPPISACSGCSRRSYDAALWRPPLPPMLPRVAALLLSFVSRPPGGGWVTSDPLPRGNLLHP